MRFDTPIYFQSVTEGAYNVNDGNYADPTITETLAYASVSPTLANTTRIVYGDQVVRSMTVRVQGAGPTCASIRIGTRVYRVDSRRVLHNLTGYVVSESGT